MRMQGMAALVTGGASELGAETVRQLAAAGAKVAILDADLAAAQALAIQVGGLALCCDITHSASTTQALMAARQAHGPARILVNCAGVGMAGRDAASPEELSRMAQINLIATLNVIRLAAADMIAQDAMENGERGVIIAISAPAPRDGHAGDAAGNGALASLTLPLARDLAQFGVRMMTIAPQRFTTPLLQRLPQVVRHMLAASLPLLKRPNMAGAFATLALHIVGNLSLNGDVMRLDGAPR
ncbi:MAG: SDR family NAD(P)-dependent oxidoreductase [Pseudomonadota bacterium]